LLGRWVEVDKNYNETIPGGNRYVFRDVPDPSNPLYYKLEIDYFNGTFDRILTYRELDPDTGRFYFDTTADTYSDCIITKEGEGKMRLFDSDINETVYFKKVAD
jgi:hypothetical protein